MTASSNALIIRNLGHREYVPVWQAMQAFTLERTDDTPDELWLVEHPPVFTLGLNAKQEHLLDPREIPVVQIDRGGQVTYHGPGQVVIYTLLDLQRRRMGVQKLVRHLEEAVIALLAESGLQARGRKDAPGVYVNEAKIAALGLRVKRGKSYHGLAVNVDMDLQPFTQINPCGYPGMAVTQLRDLGVQLTPADIRNRLAEHLARILGYNDPLYS